MASINDNLFTTLPQYAVPREMGCHIRTQWGQLTAHFSDKGLSRLYFNTHSTSTPSEDSVFRQAFLEWLMYYQKLTPSDQWKCLAPQGTDFQLAVWRALIEVPFGERVSYQQIAEQIHRPKAHRAVGTAVGANPISMLIPCHRVILSTGAIGMYRWGIDRKRALLDAEQMAGSDLLHLFK